MDGNMENQQTDALPNIKQLCANARKNAYPKEEKMIDLVERRGWVVSHGGLTRLQEIADR